MASQAKPHQGKHSSSIPGESRFDQFSYNNENESFSNTTLNEKDSQTHTYKVFYMNGPIMNANVVVNGSSNGLTTQLQGSINPNANFFIPHLIYTQHPQQVPILI